MDDIFQKHCIYREREAKQLECKWIKKIQTLLGEQNNIGIECIFKKWDIKSLDIPYAEKDELKTKGAKLNKELKNGTNTNQISILLIFQPHDKN